MRKDHNHALGKRKKGCNDWFPVNWEAGYAWESQTRYMGTAIYTLRMVWTYSKQAP